jgi:hypothetical protein
MLRREPQHAYLCTAIDMGNPWLKKHPLLSIWLSGANAVMGATRSRASAEMKRQSTALMSQATQDILSFWSPGKSQPKRKRARKRRSR